MLVLVDIAEDDEFGEGDGGDNKTIKGLFSKKLEKLMGYFTFLGSEVNSKAFEKRKAHLIIWNIVEALN